MKITRVEAIELRLPEDEVLEHKASSCQDALIVRIHTDEGIVGIGDAYTMPRAAKALIEAPVSGASASRPP
jgi:L-alanine-DL-glutamate epimerase-like enolase superfamily enzyme